MPLLYLIAGPNGAGKSTYFEWATQRQIFPAVEQVNGDVLYKNNPQLNQSDVAVLVQQQIKSNWIVAQVLAGRLTHQADQLPAWAESIVKHIQLRQRIAR